MKKMISILLAIVLVVSLFTVIPVTTASAKATQVVYIGVNTELDQTFVTTTARIRYWGDDIATGDAQLVSLNCVAEQTYPEFAMYQAWVPAGATGFRFHNGDTWYGGWDGELPDETAAYVYDEDYVLYREFWGIDADEPIAHWSHEDTGDWPPFQVVGSSLGGTRGSYDPLFGIAWDEVDGGWFMNDKSRYQEATINSTSSAGYDKVEFRILYNDNPCTSTQVFSVKGGPCKIIIRYYPATGNVVVTSNNDGAYIGDPVEHECEEGYYLVGDVNDWTVGDQYMFTENTAEEGEYMLKSVYLSEGKFKVKHSGGDIYPDGWGTDYQIEDPGYYDVYFRPDGQGGYQWHYGAIYAERVTKLTGYNIGLEDEIAFYFYASVDEYSFDAVYMLNSDDGFGNEIGITGEEIEPSETYGYANCKFTVPIAAKSMTDTITLRLNCGGDDFLISSSVAAYAVKLHEQDDSYDDLLCAMLDYGTACQKYFDYTFGDPANDFIGQIDPDWAEPDAPNADLIVDTTTLKKSAVSSFMGTIMSTTSRTAIYLYFDKAETAAISADEYDCEVIEDRGCKCLAITGIPAAHIFDDITVRVGNDAYIYNAANYYKAIKKSADDNINRAQNVIERMYVYYKKAHARLT